jgi:glycosyltransferase involved in cell wall biosynthesis
VQYRFIWNKIIEITKEEIMVFNPTVRVIIPNFNGERFIAAAIESVLSQSFQDWELYIVDDGSTDKSTEIIERYCSDRIILIRQNNKGDEAARVKAMEGAGTKYIARLDADDVMLPDRLEKQVKYLDENPSVGLLGGQIAYISEDGKKSGFRSWWPNNHDEILALLVSRKGSICNPTLMVRREIHIRLIWPGPGLPGKDLGYVLEISRLCKIENLPDVINYMRIHNASIQSRKNPFRRVLLEEFYIDRYFRELLGTNLVDWEEFANIGIQKNVFEKFLDWRELKIGRSMRKAMWTWLNRNVYSALPIFAFAALLAPERVVFRLLRIVRTRSCPADS